MTPYPGGRALRRLAGGSLGLPIRALLAVCLFVAGFSLVTACGGRQTSTTIPNSQRPHITTTIGGTLTTVVTGP